MRTILHLLCLIALVFGLCAEPLSDTLPKEPHITLLLEDEGGSDWNRLLRKGLERASRDFPIHASVRVARKQSEEEALFRETAKHSDLTLVGTHHFHEILRDNAANFRKTHFGVIDAKVRGPNVTCINFRDEEAAFLAGAAAALFLQGSEKKGEIGWLSGEDVPAMRSMFHNFTEGAKLISPAIRVIHGVAGSFSDPEGCVREARRLLRENVQVIVLAGGSGNSAVLETLKENGCFVIGLDRDQKALFPRHVLLSIVKNADEAVYEIIADFVQGKFKGKEIKDYDLTNGVHLTKPSESLGFSNAAVQKTERRVNELRHEIENHGIQIKSLRTRALCDCL